MNFIKTGDIKDNKNSAIALGSNLSQVINGHDKADDLFQKWLKEIQGLPNVQDIDILKADICDIKDNLLNSKPNAAKKLFSLLPETIRTTAAALSIASHFLC